MRRWPRPIRYSVAITAPLRLSDATVGRLDEPVCGSTATTGVLCSTSTTDGVTRMVPSVSVPLTRDR